MIKRLFGAAEFLTVIPVPVATASPGESAAFFPLIGALVAALPAAFFVVFRSPLGASVTALLALAMLGFLTGCLHEDGLADVADAVRPGRTREAMLAILADSAVGVYGAVAVIFSVLIRWQAIVLLADQSPRTIMLGLVSACSLARAAMVVVAGCSTPLGSGLGSAFVASCSRAGVWMAAILAIAISALSALAVGWSTEAAMLASAILASALARWFFLRHLGGLNGDCLGATCQAVEIVTFLALACGPYF